MTRGGRRLLDHRDSARGEQLGGFYRAKEEFNGSGEILSYLNGRRRIMKLTTIAFASALALISSAALAQATYAPSIGSVVAPSVGSYVAPAVGSYMNQPTWSNTGPAAPLPSSPALAPIPTPAPIIRMSGVRR